MIDVTLIGKKFEISNELFKLALEEGKENVDTKVTLVSKEATYLESNNNVVFKVEGGLKLTAGDTLTISSEGVVVAENLSKKTKKTLGTSGSGCNEVLQPNYYDAV